MEFVNTLVNQLNGVVWGPPMLVLILGTGLFLMLRLKFMPLSKIGAGFKLMWQGRQKGDAESGEISPFQALMTCLAATVGTGNIAGVATAINFGGHSRLYTFSARRGEPLTILLEGLGFSDTYLNLYGPAGDLLASADGQQIDHLQRLGRRRHCGLTLGNRDPAGPQHAAPSFRAGRTRWDKTCAHGAGCPTTRRPSAQGRACIRALGRAACSLSQR